MGNEKSVQAAIVPVERPEDLPGATYKVKAPTSDHALYVTINDILINEGTEDEQRVPFEIFLNSKNMDHFQWVVGLTRVISMVFRDAAEAAGKARPQKYRHLVDELHSVFDPKGGYFKKGGKFVNSLVSEIGDCIEQHLQYIGALQKPELDEHQKKLITEKRAQYDARNTPAAAPGAAM